MQPINGDGDGKLKNDRMEHCKGKRKESKESAN